MQRRALHPLYNAHMNSENLSRELCEEIATWRYEQLPDAVVKTVKALILDALGVIGGAARAPGIPELNARLARWEKSGSATSLIGKRRYSPPSAALANGAAAHALDFDDQHDPARVHTSCVVLPALLATAEDDETQADRLADAIANLESADDAGRAIVGAFPAATGS